MADQTLLLNVSDGMKLDDERQTFDGKEHGVELCSFSSDTTEELYSLSAPDTCGECGFDVKGKGLILLGLRAVIKVSTQPLMCFLVIGNISKCF